MSDIFAAIFIIIAYIPIPGFFFMGLLVNGKRWHPVIVYVMMALSAIGILGNIVPSNGAEVKTDSIVQVAVFILLFVKMHRKISKGRDAALKEWERNHTVIVKK